MAKSPSNGMAKVFKMIKDHNVKMIDLKFVDFPGQWQHFSLTPAELTESAFTEGAGFDGSSIRGFQKIHESDMVLIPDPQSCFMDPFTSVSTLNIICNVKDPVIGKLYPRDPRYVAEKAEEYLKKSGVADTAYFGPEAEFFILDSVRFDQSYNFG
jgi:glutamine synthetase